MLDINNIYAMDCLDGLRLLDDESVNCCVTSPPYWHVRDYHVPPTQWPTITYIPMAGLPPVTVPEWTGCLGLEPDPMLYVAHIVLVFREVKRVLWKDGTLWLNFGDTYSAGGRGDGSKDCKQKTNFGSLGFTPQKAPIGYKPKDLIGIPWRVAFALQADGWYLRNDIIWAKQNCMPESVTDRCTKSHEYLFLFSKSKKYFFDAESIKEPAVWERGRNGTNTGVGFGHGYDKQERGRPRYGGKKYSENPDVFFRTKSGSAYEPREYRNKRDVWFMPTAVYKEAHFATYPKELVEPCILAGTSARGHCQKCGAHWVREIERVDRGWDGSQYGERAVSATGGVVSGGTQRSTLGSSNGKKTGQTRTTGWQPTCKCGLDSVPDIVLDPFMGSGTTAQVAIELQRNYIGFDIKPEYVDLANEKRLNAVQIRMVDK